MLLPGSTADKANAAIQHIGVFWLGTDDQRAAAIKASYGEDVFKLIREVGRTVEELPVDWTAETLEAAVSRLSALLARIYPWLDATSIRRLQTYFAYIWR